MWSGLPLVVFRNCPINASHGNIPVGSTYQTGCGAFCQESIAGLAKSLAGDSKEPLGMKMVAARSDAGPRARHPATIAKTRNRRGFLNSLAAITSVVVIIFEWSIILNVCA